ncbi:MAG: hypothetical protein ACOX18_00285 [Bacillota bacterium]
MTHQQQPAMSPPVPDIAMTMTNYANFQGNFNLDKSGFMPGKPGHDTEHRMILRQQPRTVKGSRCRHRPAL